MIFYKMYLWEAGEVNGLCGESLLGVTTDGLIFTKRSGGDHDVVGDSVLEWCNKINDISFKGNRIKSIYKNLMSCLNHLRSMWFTILHYYIKLTNPHEIFNYFCSFKAKFLFMELLCDLSTRINSGYFRYTSHEKQTFLSTYKIPCFFLFF